MGLFDSIFGSKPKAPEFQQLQLQPYTNSITDFMKQESYFPDLSRITGELNQDYQKNISSVLPSYMSNLQKAGQNTTSLLNGEIPTDVGNAIARTDIAKSLGGGFGIGSGMGRNLVARDLGLTSLQLQQTGNSQLSGELQQAQALNPNSMSSFLFTPQQLLQRSDFQSVYNNGWANQAEMIKSAKSGQKGILSGLLSTAGSIVGGIYGGALGSSIGGSAGNMIGGSISNMAGGWNGN